MHSGPTTGAVCAALQASLVQELHPELVHLACTGSNSPPVLLRHKLLDEQEGHQAGAKHIQVSHSHGCRGGGTGGEDGGVLPDE